MRRAWEDDAVRLVVLTLYYLAIIAGLILMYGGNNYTPPPFVYQGF
jgi:D-Ala-teichoic acid biosynthesis protein